MKSKEQAALEKHCGCNEKDELVFHCFEYMNYYCPRICHYVKQKLATETRVSEERRAEYYRHQKFQGGGIYK